MAYRFESVADVRTRLQGVDYLADEGIAGVVYLADRLGKPVLVEGPAGTGKTQLAKSVAEITGSRLIRLQCYEGLDESKALYEWNYKKQLLRIQAERNDRGRPGSEIEDDIFSDDFLLTRPLLEAIRAEDPWCCSSTRSTASRSRPRPCCSRSSPTTRCRSPSSARSQAKQIPLVFLTSNNTRELSEALKRRCLFLHIDYPDMDREKEIVLTKVPDVTESLADQVARIVRSHPPARAEEVARRCPRRSTGPAPWCCSASRDRRRGRRRRHHQHPAQVPDRHRQGGQGAGRRQGGQRRALGKVGPG